VIEGERPDLVLSSGFLAFGRHIGFFRGLEAMGVEHDAIVGTSSGSIVGALRAAGHGTREIEALVEEFRRPILKLRPHVRPLVGVFSMRSLIGFLRPLLPPRIEDLSRPFAVGVMDARGRHRLLTRGPLPEVVAASSAVPRLFAPVNVDGEEFRDGGAVDRLGVAAWRSWRPGKTAIVHRVARTMGVDARDPLNDLVVVDSAPSGASLFSLGNLKAQIEESERRTRAALEAALAPRRRATA
jgi:predicted acylesterase/phospholipase RssA